MKLHICTQTFKHGATKCFYFKHLYVSSLYEQREGATAFVFLMFQFFSAYFHYSSSLSLQEKTLRKDGVDTKLAGEPPTPAEPRRTRFYMDVSNDHLRPLLAS